MISIAALLTRNPTRLISNEVFNSSLMSFNPEEKPAVASPMKRHISERSTVLIAFLLLLQFKGFEGSSGPSHSTRMTLSWRFSAAEASTLTLRGVSSPPAMEGATPLGPATSTSSPSGASCVVVLEDGKKDVWMLVCLRTILMGRGGEGRDW